MTLQSTANCLESTATHNGRGRPKRVFKAVAIATTLLASSSLSARAELSVSQTRTLIIAAEPDVRDAGGWAKDMHKVFAGLKIAPSEENVCSVIATVDQESGFVANPVVPRLGEISLSGLKKKLDGWSILGTELLKFWAEAPTSENSILDRIRKARTEKDLDLAYRDGMAAAIEYLGLTDLLATRLATDILENQNEIRTIGSMQVSVDFAFEIETRKKGSSLSLDEIYRIRNYLYTRQGGLHYGIAQLLGYVTGYGRKVYRFADYNAGRYASRNAAVQYQISRLTKTKLAYDGDLLLYSGAGKASSDTSLSERAIQKLSVSMRLGLSNAQIRKDLLQEKQKSFILTPTFKLIKQAYGRVFGAEPPFAILPDIRLSSVKLTRRMTTADFARSVDRRYQACMTAIKSAAVN